MQPYFFADLHCFHISDSINGSLLNTSRQEVMFSFQSKLLMVHLHQKALFPLFSFYMKPVKKTIATHYWFLTSIAVFRNFHKKMIV